MSEPLSTPRQQQLLQEMVHLVARRAAAEQDVRQQLAATGEAAEAELRSSRQQHTEAYEQEKWQTQQEYQNTRRDELTRFQEQQQTTKQQYAAAKREIESTLTVELAELKDAHQDACWEAATLFDTSKNTPNQKLAQVKKQIKGRRQQLHSIDADAVALLKKRRQWRECEDPAASGEVAAGGDPREVVKQAAEKANQMVRALADLRIPRLFIGARPLGLMVVLALVLFYPATLALGIDNVGAWAGASFGVSFLATIALCGWLYPRAKQQSAVTYQKLRQVTIDAEAASQQWLSAATAQSESEYAEMVERRDRDTQRADDRLAAATETTQSQRDEHIGQADTKYPALLQEMAAQHKQTLAEIEEKYPRLLADIESRFSGEMDSLLKHHASQLAAGQEAYDRDYAALKNAWHAGMDRLEGSIDSIIEQSEALFPEWPVIASGDWTPPEVAPPAIRFGSYSVDLQRLKNGVSTDYDLRRPHSSYNLPALLTFPQQLSMLLKAQGSGRGKAVEMMQAVMLRLLVSIPPGKVRFTILDPVGLGENFAAFMHLADFDESLVTHRIWTEAAHIEQRLADLTEHMENVIQKYLRNEFESIEKYNEYAGEVAEPYHVLVAANFPNNFNENAVRRLASIASTGPRCGVYTLISVDTQQTLPHNFNLADLEAHAVNLQWKGGRFLWQNPALQKMPLTLDSPPPPAEFTEIVRNMGEFAKDANRVEVPFEFVTPKNDLWWTHNSAASIDVALGRAGATKLQYLRLGKGTSQHVLMAGKTGSGKSTLLHAIVVNLALHYSPEQVEFYLVDFKKGVEFKTYATLELPHARVIAIESEREFGLSVLQRLDAELKRRGDLFRDLGVQDLAGFRKANPQAVLPRTLLVIDEFQEMFVEDDKLSQDASLLLDRLVRQGRAFGMHVLLGSQTLGGAYSLPRSTIGQMAVRVALQCSEADAHLILSEDNTAARLLSRPGEAIYNDANGLLEGNHPFQVVWLADDRREEYLRRIKDLAEKKNMTMPPPIVFEGNIPADPSRNPLLAALVEQSDWTAPPQAPVAWVGAAIAIKDPTATVFRRQSGANLLMVGQQPEAAVGILSTCLVSLAAQLAPGDATNANSSNAATGARFYLLDGTPPELADAGAYRRVAKALPHQISIAGAGELPAMIGEIAEEVTRREASGETDHPPIFLVIHDLGRLRDLRKVEDDFSFSRSDDDKPSSPGKQFAAIFRDGPAMGVHTLAWCDSYNNVNRSFDRQGLREFENRILFQMSSTDSSNLIDSPAAGKLGVNRALLYSEEHGQAEKFRPYGTPSDEWLASVAGKLRGRTTESPIV